jgi:hypothetical protein
VGGNASLIEGFLSCDFSETAPVLDQTIIRPRQPPGVLGCGLDRAATRHMSVTGQASTGSRHARTGIGSGAAEEITDSQIFETLRQFFGRQPTGLHPRGRLIGRAYP